jgi:hypothetical protein
MVWSPFLVRERLDFRTGNIRVYETFPSRMMDRYAAELKKRAFYWKVEQSSK